MVALIGYLSIISALFAVAALGAEKAFARRSWRRRPIWLLTLTASLAFPMTMAFTTPRLTSEPVPIVTYLQPTPAPGNVAAATTSQELASRTSAPSVHEVPVPGTRVRPAGMDLTSDELLLVLWGSSSAGVMGWFIFLWIRLSIRVRQFPKARVQGCLVRVTDRFGPVVFGFLRPQILLPQSLLEAPLEVQRIALAHEVEHARGRDPMLLLLGLILTALAPWNPILWWQLQRLRFAIEADCDSRVLRSGVSPSLYAEALLSAARHGPLGSVAMMAAGSGSMLERRIRAFMIEPPDRSRLQSAAGLLVAFAIVGVAACVQAPGLAPHELRKRPSQDVRPAALSATAAARAHFPQIFNRHFDGTAVVAVLLNRDGSLKSIDLHRFAAGTPPSDFDLAEENARFMVDAVDDIMDRGGEFGSWTLGPWLKSSNPGRVFVVYEVLKWPHDPMRTRQRVQAALAAYDPSLLGASSDSQPDATIRVTVLMKDDGTVDRESKREIPFGTPMPDDALDRFAALGVKKEQLGRLGFTVGLGPNANSVVRIDYCWLKRPDEPADIADSAIAWREVYAKYPELQDTADDAAIFARYFPDIANKGWAAADVTVQGRHQVLMPWILFGRDGRVWDSGRWPTNSDQFRFGAGLEQELAIRYPGAQVSSQNSPCRFNKVPIACLWVTADSPAQALKDVDLSKRQDVLLTGAFLEPSFMPKGFPRVANLDFAAGIDLGTTQIVGFRTGRPALFKASATSVNSNEIELRISVPSYGVNPFREPADWLQTQTLEVTYGTPAILTLSDGESNVPAHNVQMILRAQRLRGT